jgi:MOSC domain-containing protein YiiM
VGVDAPSLRVVSVNVATPSTLGIRNGKPVRSAIAKRPVLSDSVWLDWNNVSGDRQGDTRVHGGPDKAVYCYPHEHFAAWQDEIGRPFGPGAFGEMPTGGAMALEHRDERRLSILDAHRAFSSDDPADAARLPALIGLDALADSWRRMLRRRVQMIENRAS